MLCQPSYNFPRYLSECITKLILLGMIYVHLCKLPWSNPKRFLMAFITFVLSIVGYMAAVLSLLDIMGVIDLKSM
jgi:hypothetical protein